MVALTNQEKQIVDLFRGLPAERRPQVLLAIAGADPDTWKRYQEQGEQRLRHLASGRGLDWDNLSDDQRQDFISDVLDERQP